MLKLPNTHQLIIVNLVIVMLGIYIVLDPQPQQFAFNAEAVQQGSWWLALSGHYYHLNAIHLIANLAYFALLTYVFMPTGQALALATIKMTLIVGLLAHLTQINGLIGMSGVLHALTAYLAIHSALKGKKEYWIVLFALTVKVAHETAFGVSDNITWLLGGEIPPQVGLVGIYAALALVALEKTSIALKSYHYHEYIKQ